MTENKKKQKAAGDMTNRWKKDKPKDTGTFSIGCMDHSHRDVPYVYEVKPGEPRVCPGCGRHN